MADLEQYKGVRGAKKKFKAHVWSNGKELHLGTFDTPTEAARAYDAAVRSKGGNVVNFPDEDAGEVKAVVGEKKEATLKRSAAAAAPSPAAPSPAKQPRLAAEAEAKPAGPTKVASPSPPASTPLPPPLKKPQPQPQPQPDFLASLEAAVSQDEAATAAKAKELEAARSELAAKRAKLKEGRRLHAANDAASEHAKEIAVQAARAAVAAAAAAAAFDIFKRQQA